MSEIRNPTKSLNKAVQEAAASYLSSLHGMEVKMSVREKFELSDGTTIFSCPGCKSDVDLTGRRLKLQGERGIRKTLTISGERKMVKKNGALDQRAFETNDEVQLLHEEARSGEWMLVE